jgi:hypothetical protein
LTAQGHPRAIFKRAIERGNLVVSEMAARELGRITLDESLALVALVAAKDPPRHSRYAVRWLRRLLVAASANAVRSSLVSCLLHGVIPMRLTTSHQHTLA